MLCLGFSGGLNRVYENPLSLAGAFSHDSAAVLIQDGVVLAAVEEERLNRIKHSNKFPTEAIRYCLESANASIGDIDCIAYYATEAYCNALLDRIYLDNPKLQHPLKARAVVQSLFKQEFDTDIDASEILFVSHHLAHAFSTHTMSGFKESLILAIDGYGDFLSGMVAQGHDTSVTQLDTFPQSDSLGLFYLEVIRFVGYGPFDEYKVMGLAPYGNPATYRDVISQFYELLPEGGYRLFLDRIAPKLLKSIQARKKGQPFNTQHKDLSASLQEALEHIVFHVVQHWHEHTGLRKLCLAGGVAHNCTMTGKLLYSGLFDDVFVQPAAHDAGCALGAALIASHKLGKPAPCKQLLHVYWGRDIGHEASIEQELSKWGRFLAVERSDNIARHTAELIASSAVIGWVQGRSEFGPRALGNRSILADPRPPENKDRINQIVKKREGYRPFAPSVLEEDADAFFDLPPGQTSLPFMNFVVNVREDKRQLLGAITHVDGTARLQTVSQHVNPEYWAVIKAFKDITGVSVVLNTSFNNNAEPIVDSVKDAVTTFLTTDLDYLVVGPFIAKKQAVTTADWLSLRVSLPPYTQLHQTRAFANMDTLATTCEIRANYNDQIVHPVSPELFNVLIHLDDDRSSIGQLFEQNSALPTQQKEYVDEVRDLWAARMLTLEPLAGTQKYRGDVLNPQLVSSGAIQS